MKRANRELKLAICVGLLATLVASGCRSDRGALPPINTTVAPESSMPFVLMDKGAQRSVTCTGIEQRFLADGRLEVAANIRNRENRRIQVQVNCEFKDEAGFTIDSTPWQTLILTENGQETVRFTSMNNRAKRFTVRVRQAR